MDVTAGSHFGWFWKWSVATNRNCTAHAGPCWHLSAAHHGAVVISKVNHGGGGSGRSQIVSPG
jgi:hypothetical protein